MNSITNTAIALSTLFVLNCPAQITETFETFTLTPNSFYQDSNGTDWQSTAAMPISFEYGWKGGMWSSGSVYTNIMDTVNLTSSNLYGAVTGSAKYGVNYATVKDSAMIYFKNTPLFLNKVSGFFITNTSYVNNILKNGDATHRKFGDTTGTGWGNTTAQGHYPDWFKLTVYGYYNGIKNPTHVDFYLANYQAAGAANDYIVKTWNYVNCINVGFVDSLQLILSSSDQTSTYKMKTPGYFSIDHVTTTNNVGINELDNIVDITLSPNPTNEILNINYALISTSLLNINIFDISGKEVIKSNTQQNNIGPNQLQINTANLQAGIYFLNISNGQSSKNIKFIKL